MATESGQGSSASKALRISRGRGGESVLRTARWRAWCSGTFGNGLTRFHGGEAMNFVPLTARRDAPKSHRITEDRAGDVLGRNFYHCTSRTRPPAPTCSHRARRGREVRGHVTALLRQGRIGSLTMVWEWPGFRHNALWLRRRRVATGLIRTLCEDGHRSRCGSHRRRPLLLEARQITTFSRRMAWQ